MTRTTAASNTAAKIAMPARRAVSPTRSEPPPGKANAHAPAPNEYKLKANASRRAKLPICDMGIPAPFFQKQGMRATKKGAASPSKIEPNARFQRRGPALPIVFGGKAGTASVISAGRHFGACRERQRQLGFPERRQQTPPSPGQPVETTRCVGDAR